MTMKAIAASLPDTSSITRASAPALRQEAATTISGRGSVAPRRPTNPVETRDSEAMTSLTLLLGSSLVEVWDDSLDANGQWDGNLVGLEGPSPTPEARQLVDRLTTPADRATIAPMLRAMAEAMPSQGGSAAAIGAWMELVWMSIDEFPADIIQQAAKALVRREKWRPTPADLRQECQWLNRKRAALKAWTGRC